MSRRRTVFMFSGQGSQYFQMGRQLFDTHPAFRRCMTEMDECLGARAGISVIQALYTRERGRGEVFDELAVTHPAIFMVEYALAQVLIQQGVVPDVVLGTSLGAFAAAAVAGMLSPHDALEAVLQQAKAFEERCTPGGMLAVLAPAHLYQEAFFREQSTLASVNFASHFTVSAPPEALQRIEGELKRKGVTFQRLPVRFAFHSEWIDEAREACIAFVSSLPSCRAITPMLCCMEARVLHELPAPYLWDVVRRPMRLLESIAVLERQGPHRYIDAGPSGTLATFLKYGLQGQTASTMQAVLTPFGSDVKNLAALTTLAGG